MRTVSLLLIRRPASERLWGERDPIQGRPARAIRVSLLVFGEPEELKAYRAVVGGGGDFERREPAAEVELIEASDEATTCWRGCPT